MEGIVSQSIRNAEPFSMSNALISPLTVLVQSEATKIGDLQILFREQNMYGTMFIAADWDNPFKGPTSYTEKSQNVVGGALT